VTRRAVAFALAASLLALAAPAPAAIAGTKVNVRDSEYGAMLWGPDRQAIYVFENDKADKSRCYGKCAKAWPPVLTDGRPKAGSGVDEELLRTTRRKNGDRQVTYSGRPLYFYAHEGSGDVFCHDVKLNGGFWWVVGPDGVPRP
jgi:predicted lipoprotein with Yx(FWY)xxD motif